MPSFFIKNLKYFLFLFLTIAILLVGRFAITIPSTPDISKAANYTLLDVSNSSYQDRVRKSWIAIAPKAITAEERAQTAILAAMELKRSSGVDVVQIYIQKDYDDQSQIANAWYAQDNGGMNGEEGWTWQITVSDPTTGDVVPYEVVIKK